MKTEFLGDKTWACVDRFARGNDRKSVAVAYISSVPKFRFSKGDEIIVNASENAIRTRQTSASFLLAAARRGAAVYSLSNLHAKIVLTAKIAIVGSANLSASSRKLHEAAVAITDADLIREAHRYFRSLRRRARRLRTSDLVELAKIPLEPSTRRAKHQKPSLLQALLEESPVLNEMAHVLAFEAKLLPQALVQDQARRRGIPLRRDGKWEWLESDYSSKAFTAAKREFEGRPAIIWQGEQDLKSSAPLSKMRLHKLYAVQTLDIFRIRGKLIHLVSTSPHTLPINLKLDHDRLRRILNRGLKANSVVARKIGTDPVGRITRKQLQSLFQDGERA